MYTYKELYTLDFRNVKDYADVHRVIKRELDFPDYYWGNLDAFWDCLTDMYGDPIHIEIIGLDVIERKFGADTTQKMLEILKSFKHFGNDMFSDDIKIEIVSEDIRINVD